jgi:arylsulfatase A-like enzyme
MEKNMQQLKKNTERNVCTIDIAPTIVDILGLTKNKAVNKYMRKYEGNNLFSRVPKYRSIITMNNNEVAKFWVGISVIRGDYHYVHRVNVVPNREEVYNLRKDPKELKNINHSMSDSKRKWLQETLFEHAACNKYMKRN